MLFWGSWTNTFKLTEKSWRYELYYRDYLIGIILFSPVFVFTLGSIGNGGKSFMPDIAQAEGSSLWYPLLGGINYIYQRYGKPLPLFIGLTLAATAIVINAVAYSKTSLSKGKVPWKGIILSVAAGILMSLFYRIVAAAMVENMAEPEEGKITPYTAMFLFSLGMLLSNFVFNT